MVNSTSSPKSRTKDWAWARVPWERANRSPPPRQTTPPDEVDVCCGPRASVAWTRDVVRDPGKERGPVGTDRPPPPVRPAPRPARPAGRPGARRGPAARVPSLRSPPAPAARSSRRRPSAAVRWPLREEVRRKESSQAGSSARSRRGAEGSARGGPVRRCRCRQGERMRRGPSARADHWRDAESRGARAARCDLQDPAPAAKRSRDRGLGDPTPDAGEGCVQPAVSSAVKRRPPGRVPIRRSFA